MEKGLNVCAMHRVAAVLLAAAASFVSTEAAAVDADAAQALARQSKCMKCHAIDKKKEGPAWKDISKKYKGKADAEAKLIKHVTTGPKVKFDDGTEDDHPILKSKGPEDTKNLVQWLLSL